MPHRWYEWPGWTAEKKTANFEKISADFEYWNTLIYVQGNLEGVSMLTDELIQNLDQVVILIQEEIEMNK